LKRKLVIAFLLMMFAVGLYISYQNNHKTNTVDSTQDTRLSELQTELDKYKQKEQNDKIRKLELLKLQKPEIILNRLEQVGKLIVYEGTYIYSECVRENNWYSNKDITLELKYNFGIGIDLGKITMDQFIDDKVVLNLPVKDIIVQYIELDNSSKIVSNKTFLATQYKPEEVKLLLDDAHDKVKESINNNKNIFDAGIGSLKVDLTNLIVKLGYSEVLFNEIYE